MAHEAHGATFIVLISLVYDMGKANVKKGWWNFTYGRLRVLNSGPALLTWIIGVSVSGLYGLCLRSQREICAMRAPLLDAPRSQGEESSCGDECNIRGFQIYYLYVSCRSPYVSEVRNWTEIQETLGSRHRSEGLQ